MQLSHLYFPNGVLIDKFFIFRAGWENLQKQTKIDKNFVHLYKSQSEYMHNMRVHVWDFILRYCQKPFRLTQYELEELHKFLKDFIEPKTQFGVVTGRVLSWSAAVLFFFASVHLRGRQPYEITIQRINEITQLPDLNEFKEIIALIKSRFIENKKSMTSNVEQIVNDTNKVLGTTYSTVICKGSIYMSKQIATEFTDLSFKREIKNVQT